MRYYDVNGKHVIITGASSGLGRELAKRFAAAGAVLYLGCLPSERKSLETLAGDFAQRYSSVPSMFPVDLADDDGAAKLYRAVKKATPRIDVLVNNAGIMAYGPFHELSLEGQERIVRVNLMAYLRLMRLFLPHIIAAKGRVLNVVSVSAFQPAVYQAVYGATKAFVQSLSEGVNEELRGTGVKVCTLNPPYTETPLLHGKGFPERLWWYRLVGILSAEEVARKGFRAFARGKAVYVPGLRHHVLHRVVNSVLPRSVVNRISRWVCRGV